MNLNLYELVMAADSEKCKQFKAAQYADELFELHGSADQIEAHMESDGYSDDAILVQLRRLNLRRVYVRETCNPA